MRSNLKKYRTSSCCRPARKKANGLLTTGNSNAKKAEKPKTAQQKSGIKGNVIDAAIRRRPEISNGNDALRTWYLPRKEWKLSLSGRNLRINLMTTIQQHLCAHWLSHQGTSILAPKLQKQELSHIPKLSSKTRRPQGKRYTEGVRATRHDPYFHPQAAHLIFSGDLTRLSLGPAPIRRAPIAQGDTPVPQRATRRSLDCIRARALRKCRTREHL